MQASTRLVKKVMKVCTLHIRAAAPYHVELPVLIPGGVSMTRVVVGRGVHVVEVVSGAPPMVMKMNVYSDVLLIDRIVYPSLVVLRFSV